MAEKNFQDYDDLGVAPAAGDFLLVRDVSDLTDSPDGTLKEATVANLQAAIVPDNSITFAKLQDVSAASRLLGRGDSGAGDPQEIVIGSGLTMTGTTLSAAGAGLPTNDTNPLVQDPVDNTRRTRIDTGAVATATTRTIIMPDQDVDLTPTTGTFLGSGNDLVTNARLANMAQATFKGRQAAAGTGDPEDLTAAQAKTALAITPADITGDFALSQIADIASPTVLANVSGAAAAPAATSPTTFKTEFGFGLLADKNNINVSDISASGTPSASTFLRGDGSWAGVVASVTYAVLDIDDGTTLTAAHRRYQISGGNLQVLKLRLRNSTNQANAVTVTMPDSSTVTAAGTEFDFIQAADQTGVCTIQRETNGTINGANSVALAGLRATAVLIIDANAGTAPVARLEGETDETRTIQGATTFDDQAVFTAGIDINGASTLSHTLTLDGSGAIVGGDKVASALELKDIAETFLDAGNKSGAVSFDYTAGAWQKCIATANISSVSITNPPASGRTGTITLEIHQDGTGGRTIAWGAAFRFPSGTDFTLSAAANAIDIFTLTTRDGGTTWYAFEGGKAFAA